jgi:hypothetical protein
MPLTAQNSEEQTMLDIMELRGFRVEHNARKTGVYLDTPDGFAYAVQEAPHSSQIEMAFAMFQQVNHHYP